MDVLDTIRQRRSCRKFAPAPVEEDRIAQILEAAAWAPSPLNAQPWEFVVITSAETKAQIHSEAERCRSWAVDASGWKWLDTYRVDFLAQAPVIIAVVGDPNKSGVDRFQPQGALAYQHACAAAIQNMLLAAHALGLGSLWFTLFERDAVRRILAIGEDKIPLALVCIGQAAAETAAVPRKDVMQKTTYLR
jgi:nitroreductase